MVGGRGGIRKKRVPLYHRGSIYAVGWTGPMASSSAGDDKIQLITVLGYYTFLLALLACCLSAIAFLVSCCLIAALTLR